MLRTDAVIKLLKKQRELSFDEIWETLREETMSSLSKELDEMTVKSDLYMSLMEDQTFIMTGENRWALKSAYSYATIDEIKKSRVTEEDPVIEFEEETEETKELKLGITATGEDE